MPARGPSILAAGLCCLFVSLAPVPVPATTDPPAAATGPSAVKAWAILFQVVETLKCDVESKQLGLIHDEDMKLYHATSFLTSKDQLAVIERKDDVLTGWVAFGRKTGDLHIAADAFDQQEAESRLKTVLASLEEMKQFYDSATLASARSLADEYTCPMHPGVTGSQDAPCPKCGMGLSLRRSVSMYQLGTPGTAPHTIQALIRTDAPLSAGVRANGRLMLRGLEGLPVRPERLREVHTQRIHLLIIDSSLTDYHHEHPVATDTPGEYAFSFVPGKPGPYRAWADIQPFATGYQEYAVADIFAQGVGEPVAGKTVALDATVEGMRYDLRFEQAEIHAGQPVRGTIRITKAKRGAPFKKLEPLMGTFAHIVAFHEDRETVLHMHPKGTKLLEAGDRGGPELEFQLYADKPGFYRLFAQVQIDGVSKFAPFGLLVLP